MARKKVPPIDVGRISTEPNDRIAILTGQELRLDRPMIVQLPLESLWLEHQPRELVPEESLQRLITEAKARPAALLDALRWAAAADGYYGDVLAAIEGLARSIASQGVLQPIDVVDRGGRTVIRDGHRRSLASLIAGESVIPARYVQEASELEAVAHPLIVNLQRQDLTGLEKGAALLRLALLVGRRLAEEQGEDPVVVTIEALVHGRAFESSIDDSNREDNAQTESSIDDSSATTSMARTITGMPRALAAATRDRVCAMAGIARITYYNYLALNRLAPTARAQARGLTEGRLRPIISVPAERQAEVLAMAQQHRLTDEAVRRLAQVMRRGDQDEVARILAALPDQRRRAGRAAVSWESLLHAVPRDVDRRCQALEAELAALTPVARQVRLLAILDQVELLQTLQDRFRTMLHAYREEMGTSLESTTTGS